MTAYVGIYVQYNICIPLNYSFSSFFFSFEASYLYMACGIIRPNESQYASTYFYNSSPSDFQAVLMYLHSQFQIFVCGLFLGVSSINTPQNV